MDFGQDFRRGLVQRQFVAAIGQRIGEQRVAQILKNGKAAGMIGGMNFRRGRPCPRRYSATAAKRAQSAPASRATAL